MFPCQVHIRTHEFLPGTMWREALDKDFVSELSTQAQEPSGG